MGLDDSPNSDTPMDEWTPVERILHRTGFRSAEDINSELDRLTPEERNERAAEPIRRELILEYLEHVPWADLTTEEDLVTSYDLGLLSGEKTDIEICQELSITGAELDQVRARLEGKWKVYSSVPDLLKPH